MHTITAALLVAFFALYGPGARAHGTEHHDAQAGAAPAAPPAPVANRYGAGYFPNVPLVTQDGKTVRFYDDLLKGKSVALNIIYTSCTDECPLETARLAQLQRAARRADGQGHLLLLDQHRPQARHPRSAEGVHGEVRRRAGLDVPHRRSRRHPRRHQEAGPLALQRRRKQGRAHRDPDGRRRARRAVGAPFRGRQPRVPRLEPRDVLRLAEMQGKSYIEAQPLNVGAGRVSLRRAAAAPATASARATRWGPTCWA